MLSLCAFVLAMIGQKPAKVPTAADLDKLVAWYKELHLPVPPTEAVLADRGYQPQEGRFSLIDCAYAMPTKNEHGWYTIFLGIERDEDPRRAKPVTPEAKNFASLEYEFRDYDRFSQADAGLAMAAIESIRGHKEFALAVYQKWAGRADHPDYGPAKSGRDDPKRTLAEFALLHWYNACLDRSTDRAVIVAELKNLLKKYPKISEYGLRKFPSTKESDISPISDTIARLKLTVQSRYKGTDPIEKLIDELCDGVAIASELESRGIYFTEHDFDTVQALVKIGYKAIPNLIAHFDDERLVRSRKDGSHQKFGPRFLDSSCPITPVGTVCANLVAHFSGKMGLFGGGSSAKRGLKSWWAETSKISDVDKCWASLTTGSEWPAEGPIWFASAHHPDLLIKALDVVLARKDNTQIYNLLDGLVRSNLDRNVVKAALIKASKSSNQDQAHAAVLNLKKVSPEDNDEALIEILNKLPKSADKPAWLSREATYGRSVATSTSPKVWDAYLAATKRADVDLRLEMIQGAVYAEFNPTTTKLLLKYLSAFFDDKSEAKENKETTGGQHFGLPNLRVQYLALLLASAHLDMHKRPKKEATENEWQAFRKEVEAKLASLK